MRIPRIALIALAAVTLGACGDDDAGTSSADELRIKQTSANTWTIYDPETEPDRYLDRTCQTQGKKVGSVTTPGEAYQFLYVVCADESAPVPSPTPDPYE